MIRSRKWNDRGIRLDLKMVENAITLDEMSKDKLSDAMKDITELENPNSVAQMKQWLSDQGVEAESLGKKDVAKMIADEDIDEDVTEALRLRQQLAKSSVKKYQAMQNAVCNDGRARGCSSFTEPTGQEDGRAHHPTAEPSAESYGRSGTGERACKERGL